LKIAVAGIGYVGLSNAVLLAQANEVVAVDIDSKRVELINQRVSPIEDSEISDFFQNRELNLRATLNKEDAYKGAEYVIVATPTDYNPVDTTSIQNL